jgi:hypothetical protein
MSTLLDLYPRAWRRRYEAEFRGLLEARPPSARDRLDIVLGAIDARLNPQVDSTDVRAERQAGDPVSRIAAVVAGLFFSIWSVGVVIVMVPWESGLSPKGPDWLMTVAQLAAVVAPLVAVVATGSIAHRYQDAIGGGGVASAIVLATGLLLAPLGVGMVAVFAFGVGGVGFPLALAGRVLSRFVALLVGIGMVVPALGFTAFAAGNGQQVELLWPVATLGPAWVLLGLGLRRPAAVASTAAFEGGARATEPAGRSAPELGQIPQK